MERKKKKREREETSVKSKAFLPVIQLAEVASHPAASGSLERRRQRHAGCAPSAPAASGFIFLFHIFHQERGGLGWGKYRALGTVIVRGKNSRLGALNERWHCPG